MNLLLRFSSFQWGMGYVLLWQIFLRILYLFESILSEIALINKLHYFHEAIYFPDNGFHGNKKKQFLSYNTNGCYEEEKLYQKLNLVDSSYHCKNWIDWISTGWDKMSQPQKCKFLGKWRKSWKPNNFTIYELLP